MITTLNAERPQARANAAAVLALAPTDETRDLLQACLAVEKDPQVRLVFAYALARHGVAEQALPLKAALEACKGASCELPVMLVQWLPPALKVDLDQAPLARIVADKQQEDRARLFAAAALRSISHQKALEPASIEALIVAARFADGDDHRLQQTASDVVADASSLTRAAVVARLTDDDRAIKKTDDVLYPCALLARLAKVSTADDLPLLKQMMNRFGEKDGLEALFITQAVLNMKGPAANSTLLRWFNAHKQLQTMIAVGLLSGADTPRSQIDGMLATGELPTAIVIKAFRHQTDVEATLIQALDSDRFGDRVNAAELAGTMEIGPKVVERLGALLTRQDARYYPADALLRNVAMTALIQHELIRTRALKAANGGPAATAPASSAPAPAR